MRFIYYTFPEGTPENVLLANGCAVVLKNGEEIYPDTIPADKRDFIDHIEYTIYAGTIKRAKEFLKKYGGNAYTEHCERDGGLFEVTEITLHGNNSRFKYNHHL